MLLSELFAASSTAGRMLLRVGIIAGYRWLSPAAVQSNAPRHRLCTIVLALVCVCGEPVAAQAIKPLDVEKDANGVDYFSGTISTPLPVLSIPAAPNLRFQRVQDLQPVVVGNLIPLTAGLANYDVNVGGSASERFDCDEQGDCRSKKRNGSGLTPDPYNKSSIISRVELAVKSISTGVLGSNPRLFRAFRLPSTHRQSVTRAEKFLHSTIKATPRPATSTIGRRPSKARPATH